jgi:hypothetical protein
LTSEYHFGSSPHSANKTSGKHILFSIEWVFEDEAKVMTRARDCDTLGRAYEVATNVKAGIPKTVGTKRKKASEKPNTLVGYDSAEEAEAEPETNTMSSTYRMFLVEAQTSGSKQVLVPVRFDMTLGEALKDHTIVEYPTFRLQKIDDLQPDHPGEGDQAKLQTEQDNTVEPAANEEILRHQNPRD